MSEAAISVPEISCEHCQQAIEGALSEVPGVERAAVDIPGKVVHVAYRDPATPEALREAIEAQGYDVASID